MMNFRFILTIAALFYFSSCSNDIEVKNSGYTVDNKSRNNEVLSGVFLDSPVERIDYSSGSQSGTTNSKGEFDYEEGSTVIFSLGSLVLGEAQGGEIVTPLEIFPGQNTSSDQVVNFARFLQGLDIDGDPSNGIQIDPELKKRISEFSENQGIVKLDFSSLDFSNPNSNLLVKKLNDDNISIPSKAEALEHLQGTINKLNQGVRDFEPPELKEFKIPGKNGVNISLNSNFFQIEFVAKSEGDQYIFWCLKEVVELSLENLRPAIMDACWERIEATGKIGNFSKKITKETPQNQDIYFYIWLKDNYGNRSSYKRLEITYKPLIEVSKISYFTNSPRYIVNSSISGDLQFKGQCPSIESDNMSILAGKDTEITFSVAGSEGLEYLKFDDCKIQVKGENNALSNELLIPEFRIDTKAPQISSVSVDSLTGEDFRVSLSESAKISFSGGCELNTKYALKGENLFSFENLDSREYNNCTLFAKDDAGNESAHAIPTFKVPQRSDLDAGFGMIKIAPVIQKIYCRIDQNNPSKTNIWAEVTDDSPTSSISFKWTTDVTEVPCYYPECYPPTIKLVGYIIDEPESSSTFVQDFSYNDSTTINLCVTDPSGSETCLEKDIDGEVCL
jgi:hypothetical protein